MVTLTYDQADEIMKRLARIQENAIALEEERLYWKARAESAEAVAEADLKAANDTTSELIRKVISLMKSMHILDEENTGLRNRLDDRDREIAELKATVEIDIRIKGEYLLVLRNLHAMRRDYREHRGRFGGISVASELDSILCGEGYVPVEVEP